MNLLKKGIFSTLLGLGLFISCEKDEPVPEKPVTPEPKEILNEKTTILTPTNSQQISNYTSNTITFSQAQSFVAGDFIVSGINEKTPNGLLRKISSVSTDKKSINTIPATLDEVILKGEFNYSKKLTMSDLSNDSKLKSSKAGFTFNYPIKQIIYDLDQNNLTTNDQVKIEGEINFDANFYLNPKFNKGLESIAFGTTINGEANLNLTSQINLKVEKEIMFYKQKFAPILIPGPMGIPIIVSPEIELMAGIKGNLAGGIKTSVKAQVNAQGGLEYKNQTWNKIESLEKSFTYLEPTASLNANIIASAGPKLNLMVYEMVGPSFEINNYLKLNVDFSKIPWWSLYGGTEGKVGIDMGIFSKKLQNYEKSLFTFEKILAQSQGVANTIPSASFIVSPNSGNTNTEFVLNASGTFDKETPYTDLFYRWDFEGDNQWDTEWTKGDFRKTKKYFNPGTYLPKLEVKDPQGLIDDTYQNILVEKLEVITGNITDSRDGQVYKTVKIGNQLWFAENLNYYHENSNYYGNDSVSNHIYGRLYTWKGAQESCPTGWKLPTREDWNILFSYLQDYPKGGKLKSIGTIEAGTGLWHSPNYGATNETNFTAIPAGKRDYNSSARTNSYTNKEYKAYFWENYVNAIRAYSLDYYNADYTESSTPFSISSLDDMKKNIEYSVRCIKDQ